MTQKIKVILVDDHEMVRLGLKSFLNLQPDVEVVGEAGNGCYGFGNARNERCRSDIEASGRMEGS